MTLTMETRGSDEPLPLNGGGGVHAADPSPEAGAEATEAEAPAKKTRGRKPKAAAEPAQAKPVRGRKKAAANGEDKTPKKKPVPGVKLGSKDEIERERKVLDDMVKQLIPKHAKLGEIRGDISTIFANGVDSIALHKKAFRDAFRLRRLIDNDEGLKAADYLRAFRKYVDLLEIDEDTKDMFAEIDQEVGRQQDEAGGAIA